MSLYACLADPRFSREPLLLHEATANIDTRTEQLVQEAIDELLENRTAFVVAHRLSTIRHADSIVVIGEGGIKEQGSHDALMVADGYYANWGFSALLRLVLDHSHKSNTSPKS